jgi:hypothetical protein
VAGVLCRRGRRHRRDVRREPRPDPSAARPRAAAELRPDDVADLVADLAEAGLARESIRKTLTTLAQAFDFAASSRIRSVTRTSSCRAKGSPRSRRRPRITSSRFTRCCRAGTDCRCSSSTPAGCASPSSSSGATSTRTAAGGGCRRPSRRQAAPVGHGGAGAVRGGARSLPARPRVDANTKVGRRHFGLTLGGGTPGSSPATRSRLASTGRTRSTSPPRPCASRRNTSGRGPSRRSSERRFASAA